MSSDPILEVRDLRTWFHTREGIAKAVDGIDFSIDAGEVLGVVGESGCGKSVTSLSVMGLVPKPGRIESGQVLYKGRDLLTMRKREVQKIRGEEISMIFQQPQSSLNPVQRAGVQIAEVFEIHKDLKKAVGKAKATELLERVGIPDPGRRAESYPHELSGGMAQRVMIAMALALEPSVLIADEPTTALDVTIQAQILDLMRDLQRESGTAVLLITHDLGVIAEMADRVAVMYAGEIVETAEVETLFANPQHPYTKGLIGSIPVLGRRSETLATIPGIVPRLIDMPTGCRFAGRCGARVEADLTVCTKHKPDLLPLPAGARVVGDGVAGHGIVGAESGAAHEHAARCWLHQDQP